MEWLWKWKSVPSRSSSSSSLESDSIKTQLQSFFTKLYDSADTCRATWTTSCGNGRSQSSPWYKHRPLREGQIRLVMMAPGNWDDEICMTIEHHYIDDEPKYNALSYVWGNGPPSKQIRVDNKIGMITEALFKFLQILRDPEQQRSLWFDQICIDQENKPEKSRQVRLMTKIYNQASRVVCWLGEDERSLADLAFQTLEKWYEAYKDETRRVELADITMNELYKGENEESYWNDVRRALQDMFSRPWFQRVWTLQEITVSLKAHPILMCGKHSINWNLILVTFPTMSNSLPGGALVDLVGVDIVYFASMMQLSWIDTNNPNNYTLTNLIISTARRLSSNPEDKVFSLLGLSALKGNKYPPVNYSWTLEQVCKIYTRACIATDQTLRILYFAATQRESEPLSSWAINLQVQEDPVQILERSSGREGGPKYDYDASFGKSPQMEQEKSMDSPKLLLWGVPLDIIMEFSRIRNVPGNLRGPPEVVAPTWLGLLDKCRTFCHMLELPEQYALTGEDMVEAMLRTLVADRFFTTSPYRDTENEHGSRAMEYYYAYEAEARRWSKDLHRAVPRLLSRDEFLEYLYDNFRFQRSDPQNLKGCGTSYLPLQQDPFIPTTWLDQLMVSSFFQTSGSAFRIRRLIMTAKGSIGLVDDQAKIGDDLAILYGGTVPFVLRDTREDSAHHLVGEAYLHGYMYGHVLKERRKERLFCLL